MTVKTVKTVKITLSRAAISRIFVRAAEQVVCHSHSFNYACLELRCSVKKVFGTMVMGGSKWQAFTEAANTIENEFARMLKPRNKLKGAVWFGPVCKPVNTEYRALALLFAAQAHELKSIKVRYEL